MEKAIAYLDTGEMPPLWESDTVLLSEDEEEEENEVPNGGSTELINNAIPYLKGFCIVHAV